MKRRQVVPLLRSNRSVFRSENRPPVGCEALEGRTLFSTIVVNTLVDQQHVTNIATTVGPTVSLRDAVIVATNNSGATEIDLPAGTYNLGNVGTGELQIGNIAGQNISIKGLGTATNTIVHQTIAGNRIFNYDNNQAGSVAGSISNVTIENATNVNRAFGGGAILAGGPSDALTLTNCVLQSNSTANGSLNVGRNGGAISYSGGGNLTITGCTFVNNTAGGNANSGSAGGAIAYNNSTNAGNLTISNSTFSNNSATGTPGTLGGQAIGGALLISGNGTASITSTNFANNSAGLTSSAGGAIYASSMPINIVGSRFFNDSAASGGGIYNTGATITANDNWWGADALPGAAGTDTVVTVTGTTTVTKRISLSLSPANSSIATNSSTALTAKIVSTSAPTIALTGTALEGMSVTFAPGSLGSVNPASVTLANGSAGTTFASGAGFGTTSPSVTLDNGSKAASITIVGSPTANAQTVAVAFNTAKALTLTGSDPNTPPRSLTYIVTATSTHGTLSGTAPNLTYTPTAGYHGTDSFTFTTNNGFNTSTSATVTLNVAVGTPVANPKTVGTNQDIAVGIVLSGSDPDVPALGLTYFVSINPSHGTLSGTAPNLTYTPAAGYFGSDAFQFTTSNGTNTSAPATVSINVAAVPAVVSGTVGVSWGTAGTATIQTDADGLRLLPAGRHTDLSWYGINKLSITLNHPATLTPADVSISGINVANYGPVSLSGSGTNYTITLAQPINTPDRITLTIGNAAITTFTRRLDVLPGDLNDDGGVTLQDAIGIRNQYLGLAGATPSIFGDINGDGVIDINDYNLARRFVGSVLP